MVALWDLLLTLCFAMPVAGAFTSAKHLRVGLGGWALAASLGLTLGLCCAWTMEVTGATLSAHVQAKSLSLREWYLRALYFAGMLWIVFAGFLGAWTSLVLLRLLLSP